MHVFFFVGFSGSHPQDDAIYYNEAYRIYEDGFNVEHYKRMVESDEIKNGEVNPALAFALRTGMTFPIAFFFNLLGPGEVTASLFAILCSVGSIVLIFFFGRLLFNDTVGLIASFLLAIFPLQPIFGTRILSDVPVAFFMGLSVFFLLYSLQIDRHRKANRFHPGLYSFGAGLALGIAYLTKIVALMMLPVLAVYLMSLLLKKRRIHPHILLYLLGFFVIFFGEGVYYLIKTGDFLLHYNVIHSVHVFKFKYESIETRTLLPFFDLVINGDAFALFHAMIYKTIYPAEVNLVGLYFVILFFVIPFFLIRRKNLFLIFWVSFIYFYLELGFFKLSYDPETTRLQYFMIPTNPRFLAGVAIPAILLLSDFLYAMFQRKKLIYWGVMALIIISSFLAIGQNYRFYRSSLSDLRQVSDFVHRHANKDFYIDYLGKQALEFISNHKLENLRSLDKGLEYDGFDDSFVIVGGSRGNEVPSELVMENLPSEIREYIIYPESRPVTWQPVFRVTGEKSLVRSYDLTIYYVFDSNYFPLQAVHEYSF
jgi:4-amino-4-deoxy-L-arabinose transferase-like glycosyltransferase